MVHHLLHNFIIEVIDQRRFKVFKHKWTGWQKLREGTKDLCRKVWTRTKISSPDIRYFVAILRFVAIYALFGRLGAKKCFFGITTVFLGKEVHYYMVYITYTEWNVQICSYTQKRHICCKNSKCVSDKNFSWVFLPSPKGCQLLPPWLSPSSSLLHCQADQLVEALSTCGPDPQLSLYYMSTTGITRIWLLISRSK